MAGAMYDGDTRISVSLATVEFFPVGEGTRVIYTEQAAFLDGLDNPRSRREGWGQIFKSLGQFLETRGKEGERR
jgi:uncharacterized protein YndB with AHSA1/START domain